MDTFHAGHFVNQGSYKSFQPEHINRQWQISDPQLLTMLGRADRFLGRLDMFSEHVPNIELYISMHVVKEATQSSRIEGTQTNMEEALLHAEDLPEDQRSDWQEVRNYILAMDASVALLETLPVSGRLIREAHKTLLQGVRGAHKLPGEFRRSQNWIGGATLSDAVFVPPAADTVPVLMGDLEEFIHNEDIEVPELVRMAIVHYQFETIHPFLDGNGRVGRLLITLMLVSRGILSRPLLYLSDFFERNRQLYYDNLMRVRTHNDIGQWMRFFVAGVEETARKGVDTFQAVLALKLRTEELLRPLGSRAAGALRVMDRLYRHPITDAQEVAETLGKSLPSAYKLIADMERLGILHELTGSKRGKRYVFREYLDLFSS